MSVTLEKPVPPNAADCPRLRWGQVSGFDWRTARCADVPGMGRFLVRRQAKGSRTFEGRHDGRLILQHVGLDATQAAMEDHWRRVWMMDAMGVYEHAMRLYDAALVTQTDRLRSAADELMQRVDHDMGRSRALLDRPTPTPRRDTMPNNLAATIRDHAYNNPHYAIAHALLEVADALKDLGKGDAATPMGALEVVGKSLEDGLGAIAAAIEVAGARE